MPKKTPSYAAAKKWAATRPLEELQCRTKGRHNFEIVGKPLIVRSKPGGYGGYYFITKQCTVCGIPKWIEQDYIGKEMWSYTGYYKKPGYLSTIGRITGSARYALHAAEMEHYTCEVMVGERPPHTTDYTPIPAKVQRSA